MPVDWTINPTSGTPIVPGGVRQLIIGEIAPARTLFGGSIIYSKTRVHPESYLPFNVQPINIIMTPNDELWFKEGTYSPNLSLGRDVQRGHKFMREMAHAWQVQRGISTRTRGLFSRFAGYSYSLDKANLLHHGLEQQASIADDYWLLLTYRFSSSTLYLSIYRDYNPNESVYSLISKYEAVMKGFSG